MHAKSADVLKQGNRASGVPPLGIVVRKPTNGSIICSLLILGPLSPSSMFFVALALWDNHGFESRLAHRILS